MIRAFAIWLTSLFLLFALGGEALAQKPAAPMASATTTAPAAPDEEAADSPRASMRTWLELSERGRWQEASLYLDLTKGAQEKRAAELAMRLYEVLSQRLLLNPEQLSSTAQGRSTDGLPSGTEELGKINDAKGRAIAIRLVRHESKAPDDEARWVFSQSTVSHIDELYGNLQDRWIRQKLPASLLVRGPLTLFYWQWLALPVLAIASLALGRFLTWVSGILFVWLLKKEPWSERILKQLKRPATVGWALAAFALGIPWLALTLRAEEIIHRGLRALAYLTFFWALLRVVVVVGDEIAHADWARSRPSARSLSAVGVSLGKVVVAALALMAALSELGYPVTSVIAGLGIGGVALALAAQKTVENLFGSVSILIDQPFRVGDTIRVDGVEGTVERIGLRSTRVRTAERTIVIFPNGKLADMRIESLGPRDRIRFSAKLPISRSATTTQLKAIIESVRELLSKHELVKKEDVFVRLGAIGEGSYDIEVAAPIETLDGNEFARVKEELLVAVVDAVEKTGARLAIPTRQLIGAGTATASEAKA